MNKNFIHCGICGETEKYFFIDELISHLSEVHNKKQESSYFCSLCEKILGRRNVFVRHLKNVHSFTKTASPSDSNTHNNSSITDECSPSEIQQSTSNEIDSNFSSQITSTTEELPHSSSSQSTSSTFNILSVPNNNPIGINQQSSPIAFDPDFSSLNTSTTDEFSHLSTNKGASPCDVDIPMHNNQTRNTFLPEVPISLRFPTIPALLSEEDLDTSIPAKRQRSSSSDRGLDDAIANYMEKLESGALEFALTLHAKPSMPRSTVIEVQDVLKRTLFETIAQVLDPISELLPVESQTKFKKIINTIKNPFKKINTDYMLRKYLEKKQLVCPLSQVTINNRLAPVYKNGECVYDEKKAKAVIIQLDILFKKFLENGRKIDEAIINLKRLQQNDMGNREHFVQCDLWKKKMEHYDKDEIILPYFWYADGYGVNNPLRSKSCSIESNYFSFPTLEHPLAESNIISGAFMKSKDLDDFGTDKCFKHYVKQFNNLAENGIIFTIKGKKTRVKFLLNLILGDNLGINKYFDMNNHASKNSCRFCRLSTDFTRSSSKENPEAMRTIENYDQDIEENDHKATGIKKKSSLNKIKHWHVTQNKHVDVMHDWFEGILHYVMCFIILALIGCKYFTLDMLNNRIRTFSYGSIEIGNKPTEITEKHLTSKSLRMTARQLWCFTNYFGFMIGEFVTDKNNPIWLFYLKVLELQDIIMGTKFDDETLDRLKKLIDEFNTDYVTLSKDTLKPKFHNLTHYPNIIRHSGPPRFYSSLRFEAKHQFYKKYAHAITSRKNVLLTLAIKSQIMFAYHLKFVPKIKNIVCLPKDKISSNFKNVFETSDTYETYKLIRYWGTEYKATLYLPAWDENKTLSLYEIKEIRISSPNTFIVAQKIGELDFDVQYHSYQVKPCTTITSIIQIQNFLSLPVNIHKVKSVKYVKLKSFFHCIE